MHLRYRQRLLPPERGVSALPVYDLHDLDDDPAGLPLDLAHNDQFGPRVGGRRAHVHPYGPSDHHHQYGTDALRFARNGVDLAAPAQAVFQVVRVPQP